MSERLFVAIDVPESHLDVLEKQRDHDLAARWTPRDQFHLTLRFIGDVEASAVDGIASALAGVAWSAFSLRAAGLDVFPSRRKPRVLVVPVEPEPRLVRLQRRVDAALQRLGVPADPKPFNPHVTLARFKQASPQDVRRYLREHAEIRLAPFDVGAYYLYQSTLRPEGALHERIATFTPGST